MTGLQHERIILHLTQKELASQAGLDPITVRRIEKGQTSNPIASTLLACANVLDCSIEALLKEYPDADKKTRVGRETAIESETNVLLAYKKKTHATFDTLGKILGLTREGVRQACKRKTAPGKYVSLLAAHEGMSVDEFCAAYLPGV